MALITMLIIAYNHRDELLSYNLKINKTISEINKIFLGKRNDFENLQRYLLPAGND